MRLLAPKQVSGYIRPEQAGWNAVVVEWIDETSVINGIHKIAVELVNTKVPADEQDGYRKIIEELAEQRSLDMVTANLLTATLNVAMRCLAIGAEVCFPTGEVSAARYDQAERIPMIGVVRRGRGGPNNAKVVLPETRGLN